LDLILEISLCISVEQGGVVVVVVVVVVAVAVVVTCKGNVRDFSFLVFCMVHCAFD
jgi:hypothetical protein